MELSGLEYELDCAKTAAKRLKDCSEGRCKECPFYGSEDWDTCEGFLISEVAPELYEFFKALPWK